MAQRSSGRAVAKTGGWTGSGIGSTVQQWSGLTVAKSGDIPAVMLPDFLAELQSQPSFVESLDSDLVRRTFQGLLKS